jgi:predicted nucleotidyltransferase
MVLLKQAQNQMLYEFIFQCFHKHKVRYLLCGGVAVNIYGIARMTSDVDVLLDFDRSNLDRFQSAVSEIGYAPAIPISIFELADTTNRNKLINEKNLVAFSLVNTMSPHVTLDVIADMPFVFNDLWEGKKTRAMKDYDLHVVSIKDLIGLKKYAGRVQDNQDIELLKRLIDE